MVVRASSRGRGHRVGGAVRKGDVTLSTIMLVYYSERLFIEFDHLVEARPRPYVGGPAPPHPAPCIRDGYVNGRGQSDGSGSGGPGTQPIKSGMSHAKFAFFSSAKVRQLTAQNQRKRREGDSPHPPHPGRNIEDGTAFR